MTRRLTLTLFVGITLLMATPEKQSWGQDPQPATRPPARTRVRYLTPAETPDVEKVLQPAPVDGDARDIADRAIFRSTRALEGSARWALATSDNDISQSGLLKAFRCSADMDLTPQTSPLTATLLSRVSSESNGSVGALKNTFARKRPFLVDEGKICVTPAGLANSPDYPSGHTIAGWSVGLVLAELLPGRATDILNRARTIGESRVVCGVHNASAVDAGRIAATSMVAALHTSLSFKSDLEAAKAELEKIRSASAMSIAESPSCKEELQTLSVRPY
jgi:acid phosphatase (class A)